MNTRTTFVHAVTAFVLLAAASVAFAQDYEILMTRGARAGEKYELSASGILNEQMAMSSQGKTLQTNSSSFAMKLEATAEVLEVDDRKDESRISLLISRCTVSGQGDDGEKEVLKKGARVVAQMREGKQEFLVDGQAASGEAAKVLSHFISLRTGETNDDHIFGTKERRKVGDSWPVNSVKAAADLSTKGMKVAKEDITGRTTLEKLVEVDGRKCLKINAGIKMSRIGLALPAGFEIEKSNMSATFSGEFPVDPSIRRLAEEMAMTVAITAKGRPGPEAPEISLSINMVRSKRMKWKLLE